MFHFLQQWRRSNSFWRSYRVGLLMLRTLYIINRERTRVIKAREHGERDARPNLDALIRILREFRETAIELGGLLIKLGQFLGTRADLLPQEALNELAMLHDEVIPERFDDIKLALEHEWQAPINEICAWLDPEPAGSASLGQVHRAQLHDGRQVAIKVQRPGIDAIVRTDLRTLRLVMRIVSWLAPVINEITDLDTLYREFRRTVFEELDYVQEARNAEQFAEIFAAAQDVVVPMPISTYSTRKVLVLEWMDGIKISDIAALDAAGVDRDFLATRLIEVYIEQTLQAGFYHADPHPGNLLVRHSETGFQLIFLDFGMVGVITDSMRDGLRDCLIGIMTNSAESLVRGLDTLGFLSGTVDRKSLEPVISALLSHFTSFYRAGSKPVDMMNGSHSRVDAPGVVRDLESMLYQNPFRIPAQFAYFGRMIGMLLGLATALSPDIDVIAAATPYSQQFLGASEAGGFANVLRLFGFNSVEDLGQSALRESVATLQLVAGLPRRLNRILERVEHGEIHVIVEDPQQRSSARAKRRLRRQGIGQLFNRSIPLWVPLGVLSVWSIAAVARRNAPRNRHN